ncbi:MAG: hypothetical protein ABSH34_32350 [Verrucomicrobiota bacterium]
MKLRPVPLLAFLLTISATGSGGDAPAAAKPRLPPLDQWLRGPARVEIRNEVSGASAAFETSLFAEREETIEPLALKFLGTWAPAGEGLEWNLEFSGLRPRVGHTVVIELPILSANRLVFTPGERGVMFLATYPDFVPVPYAHLGWEDHRYYVLPLISVMEPSSDSAVTVALPADANIPHLQFDWQNASTLRLRLEHRGMGGAKPSSLRLLFFAHRADYRAALKAYSDRFPRYFKPVQPRGQLEGAFWYHHIQDHPDFGEMARQNVRFTWASFWFTHLGDYLPDQAEWYPYTYAKWWNLRQPMDDERIRAFIREMHRRKIGVFAYFNVTEYGGYGGRNGNAETADRLLRERFADALMKGEQGKPIGTWEGALAMNARSNCALFPSLADQLQRHVKRLPELDGFVVDRLDWASRLDYGHDDGLTMLGARRVENMAGPVAEGLAEVCRQAHAAGWRVYVNQFWRIEVLRDNDGYCHESDFVRGLGYLSPFRPAAAWHMEKPYAGDLLPFEAQLKRRLQFAVLPQMIAHQFPIAQQAANPNAADLLEIYAPLFATLDGKTQVLQPHCVSVSGANDCNLFLDRSGNLVVPVTSRSRFLARRSSYGDQAEVVTIRLPEAPPLTWAKVISADGPPYLGELKTVAGVVEITLPHHQTASMVVAGKGAAPPLSGQVEEQQRLMALRDRLFPHGETGALVATLLPRPDLGDVKLGRIKVRGTHLGAPGKVTVSRDESLLGALPEGENGFGWPIPVGGLASEPPVVSLTCGDEGTWFLVEAIDFLVQQPDGKWVYAASWTPSEPVVSSGKDGAWTYRLHWRQPEELVPSTARYEGRDSKTAGAWKGKYGVCAAWIANVNGMEPQNGYRLQVDGAAFAWDSAALDARALEPPGAGMAARQATCWFGTDAVCCVVTPPDAKPYRVSIYLFDYDRNGRANRIQVSDEARVLDSCEISAQQNGQGTYISWTVTGPVRVKLTKKAGFNVTLSGVLIDPCNPR